MKSILFLISFVFTSAFSQDFKSLDETVQSELKQKSIAGASVAVVLQDSLVFLSGYGFADAEKKISMTPDRVFRLGSTTKMFVATAALLLAVDKKLDIHAPLRTYVSDLPKKLGGVTMHQLLTHTAGLYDDAPMFGPEDENALAREIRSWEDDKIFLEPGRFISYSNPGYWLAGFIIESITKKPFAEAMDSLVFKRVGMRHSTFRPNVAQQYSMALGHDKDVKIINPPANHAGTWPSGSMFSNVTDISQFVRALMNKGRIGHKNLLPAQVVDMLLQSYVAIPERPNGTYGYGLVFEKRRGVEYVFHTGGRSGYGSMIRMVPRHKFAVIVLANRTAAIMGETAEKATEMFVKLEPTEKTGKFVNIRKDANRYEGMFICPPNIEIELFLHGILHMKRGWERVPVKKFNDSEYSNGIIPFAVTFGPDGKVQYVHAELHTMKRRE